MSEKLIYRCKCGATMWCTSSLTVDEQLRTVLTSRLECFSCGARRPHPVGEDINKHIR